MIYMSSKLKCTDNSGALTVKCIGIGKASKKYGSKSGNIITVSIKTCSKGIWKVIKGTIHKAIIVWTKTNVSWITISADYTKFFENSVVLIIKKLNYQPIGTWIFGPVAWAVWQTRFMWIVLLSNGVF